MRFSFSFLVSVGLFSSCLVPGCALFHRPRQFLVTEKDSGKLYELRVGDTITVLLTGEDVSEREWYRNRGASDVRVIAEKGSSSAKKSHEEVGEGGEKEYRFFYRVIGPGYCGISLEYRKDRERRSTPLRTFEIMISAKGEPEEAAYDSRILPPEEQPVLMTNSKGEVVPRPDFR